MRFFDRSNAFLVERMIAVQGCGFAETAARLRPASACCWRRAGPEGAFGARAVYAGVQVPISKMLAVGMEGPVSGVELDDLEDFLRTRGAPVRMELCTLADESALTLVKERGYRLALFINVHAMELGGEESDGVKSDGVTERRRDGPEIVIRRVDESSADVFAATVTRGFSDGAEPAPWMEEIAATAARQPGLIGLLAEIDGRPAGGASLFVGEVAPGRKIGILAGGSTLVGMRERGVHTALVRERVRLARAMGCEAAILQTKPGTRSAANGVRAGFALAYTKAVLVRA